MEQEVVITYYANLPNTQNYLYSIAYQNITKYRFLTENMVSGWSIRCALKGEDRNACITEWSLNISIIFYYKHFYYQIKAAHWCWRYIYLLNIPLECVINIVSFNKLQTIYFASSCCTKYLTSVQYLYFILVMTCWDCNYNFFLSL